MGADILFLSSRSLWFSRFRAAGLLDQGLRDLLHSRSSRVRRCERTWGAEEERPQGESASRESVGATHARADSAGKGQCELQEEKRTRVVEGASLNFYKYFHTKIIKFEFDFVPIVSPCT
jgi:hypothetical protein